MGQGNDSHLPLHDNTDWRIPQMTSISSATPAQAAAMQTLDSLLMCKDPIGAALEAHQRKSDRADILHDLPDDTALMLDLLAACTALAGGATE